MRVGPYELLDQLGAGGAGAVFRGRAPDGRQVAIKLLHRLTPERLARFERERQVLVRLGHEAGFVPLLDAGMSERGPYVVMPLLTGGTLGQRLRRGPLPLEAGLRLARDIAGALARAHPSGLVHRDLKPENVLFDGEGRALVADLGLAKDFDPGSTSGLSRTGELRGTLGYMAPEQARNAKRAGPPADVFAWGAVIYEALTGGPAFPGPEPLTRLAQAERGDFDPLRARCPDAPRWLEGAIARALRPEPEERFADGVELLAALSERGADDTAASPRGRGGPWVALGLVGLLLLGLGLARATGAGSAPSSPTPSASASPSAGASPSASASASASPSVAPTPDPGAARVLEQMRDYLRRGWAHARGAPGLGAIRGDPRGKLGEELSFVAWVRPGALVSAGKHRVLFWDPRSGAPPEADWEGWIVPPLAACALGPRGRWLWMATDQELIGGELVPRGEMPRARYEGLAARLQISPGGTRLALVTARGAVELRDLPGLAVRWTRPRGGKGFPQVVFLDDERLLLADSALRELDAATGQERARLAGIPAGMHRSGALVRSPDGALVLGLDAEGALNAWELPGGAPRYRKPCFAPAPPQTVTGPRRALRFGPDGGLLAVECAWIRQPGRLSRWDAGRGERLDEVEVPELRDAAPGPGGQVARAVATRVELWQGGARRWPSDSPDQLMVVAPLAGGDAMTLGETVTRWPADGPPRSLLRKPLDSGWVAPDGKSFVCQRRGGIEWAALPGGELRVRMPLPRAIGLRGVAFLGLERALVAGVEMVVKPLGRLSLLGRDGLHELPWPAAELPLTCAALDADRVCLVTTERCGVWSVSRQAWDSSLAYRSKLDTPTAISADGARVALCDLASSRVTVLSVAAGKVEQMLSFPSGTRLDAARLALSERYVFLWTPRLTMAQVLCWSLADPRPKAQWLPLVHMGVEQIVPVRGDELLVSTRRGILLTLGSPR
ncbi:MAG: protein kinase [Planctomycetota bacterium]